MTPSVQRFVRATFGDGRRRDALAFVRDYHALERRNGPFDDDVLAQQAIGVVMFHHEFQASAGGLRRAQEQRTQGKGRRPSPREIERLKRRMGLSWQTYDAALRRLEDLAAARKPRSFADAARRAAGVAS